MEFREATFADWEKLSAFYNRIYRDRHPLQNSDFWQWQYGDPRYGRAFIGLDRDGRIFAHVGGNFCDGIAWMINGYLDPAYRGQGVMSNLYDLAREYHPMAATAANDLGLGMYRSMRWVRYFDLVRYVLVNPAIAPVTLDEVCRPADVDVAHLRTSDTHYFKQPGIAGIRLPDGSTAVSQPEVGGLRMVSFEAVGTAEREAWELGYRWMDYITSWNDLRTRDLERQKWMPDHQSVVPWRLNPLIENYFCDITFLSEFPLDKDLVVHRSYSDHGRVGSL
jgi:hypothetical protein